MVLKILIGAIAAVFIAYNLVEKQEKNGRVSSKQIVLSVTCVVIAVMVGSFLDNLDVFYQEFQHSISAVNEY